MKGRPHLTALIIVGLLPVAHTPLAAQIPETFTNLQVLPRDIGRDSLMSVMRGFSFSLGARCQYCHTGGDGVSFEGVDFANDDDPDKVKARFMLRLVEDLKVSLTAMPERDNPPVEIGCKMCHRGVPKPLLLTQEMRLAMDQGSVEDAVARYRELKENFLQDGVYDFGEWEVNTLAESLLDAGRTEDAIAIYELNRESHPNSSSIFRALVESYLAVGDTTMAISRLGVLLDRDPEHVWALEQLSNLMGTR